MYVLQIRVQVTALTRNDFGQVDHTLVHASLTIITVKNVLKNCGLDTSKRRMTHRKLQKLQKGDDPPAHRLNVNVLLSNITFL